MSALLIFSFISIYKYTQPCNRTITKVITNTSIRAKKIPLHPLCQTLLHSLQPLICFLI